MLILLTDGVKYPNYPCPMYRDKSPYIYIYLKIFVAQRVYTVCTRTNYKIVPITSLNKYLHYGTSGTE